ncbi:phospho-N-acetylmuramoyl-pentapeptide-transferase [candidate division WOR-1 bacterium RIFOXYA2_FULL_36_21]|uniref:Phospho-N-acetylmuramoyl-pentapeptide-transferase n=1 Tax=candidate division WOR-1 bacterium RIFOXYB2_FULL_36_35 TaxID=1802578 RepID=A0A1F4S6E3_UNCSA|nr:MAG: phospho-N-acetylmuramoyl-pentapeptide-transferase [candidate division WOR-1 bacterium RIFOXYA2_FULL_36_21]OGC14355.1 MAG: phospho-N-acetylmuramoyl-pentapeptide-transferase [candidate division WOR-1 bacterium RIFOXYA12_FULL_36_13]OGC15969.1 MAG: phospho-N-acetylmuramoyl-pentapeptide-transferase [candidate division WOR-1 bacterium RIFOXYB2_FULL_36_35]
MWLLFFLFFLSFVFTSVLTWLILLFFSKIHIGQFEREEGPESHKKKSGTPTMGGVGFVIISIVLSFSFSEVRPLLFLFLGYSLIGFFDDFIKVYKKRNLGLTFWQKVFSQLLLSSLFSFFVLFCTPYLTSSYLLKILGIPLYILFSTFLIFGCGNATNLTDGIDGLLAGTSILAFASFFVIALHRHLLPFSVLAIVLIGGLLAFLFFNFPKAKIFMGDTGSLGIGAILAGMAIILNKELLLVIIGGVFLVEALSVIIQVLSYKLFKKRVFKMSPLHHHFELLGWSEVYVTLMFWAVQFLLSIIGVFLA